MRYLCLVLVAFASLLPCGIAAQTSPAALEPTPRFAFGNGDPLTIRQPALPNHPFTVPGHAGAILGMQDGTAELWQMPVKFFSALHLRAEVEGYSVPIELNPLAAGIEVAPDHTTITYSHAAITVRQHMFVPVAQDASDPNNRLGGQIVFEIQSTHPATLYVSLTPAMVRMWPAPQWGQPGWGWTAMGSGGGYTIATDNPALFGMLAMPNATPGDIAPYQEHPRTLPVEFRVHFDPAHDAAHLFPLLCELNRPGEVNDAAGNRAVRERLLATAQALPQIYARTQAYYAHFFDHRTVAHTPDAQFDRALAWAELAIDKSQVNTPGGETGLIAGWFPAFDSARPGFGWFFGRDTLWSMYAIDSYGDSDLARRAFTFLLRRQRADGKIMHEFSQAASIDPATDPYATLSGNMSWSKLPYEYAAADATPLFLLAMNDFVRSSGDTAFPRQHWDAIAKAYRFERTHDTDGDGVYDNAQGTGWVEDWAPHLPHQELYLAALDRDASLAFAELARVSGHPELATEAGAAATHIAAVIESYRQPNGLYAFSKNADGSFETTSTVYPAPALWASSAGLAQPEPFLRAWAGPQFATDWGTRAVSETETFYDPISYHRGSVWPLFTGWAAMAEYRGGHPLAGYSALRQNLDLTWAQDPGAVTEVLSGRFYQPLGRSSTHQLWSSAMGLAPAVRELFGVEADAPAHTLLVHPHLPADWNDATLDHVHVGGDEFTLTERREGGHLLIIASSTNPAQLCLDPAPDLATLAREKTAQKGCDAAREHRLSVPLPAVEFALDAGAVTLPSPGDETAHPHIVAERTTAYEAELTVAALPGSVVTLHLRRNGTAARNAHTTGGELSGDTLRVSLPPAPPSPENPTSSLATGNRFVEKNVRLQW